MLEISNNKKILVVYFIILRTTVLVICTSILRTVVADKFIAAWIIAKEKHLRSVTLQTVIKNIGL